MSKTMYRLLRDDKGREASVVVDKLHMAIVDIQHPVSQQMLSLMKDVRGQFFMSVSNEEMDVVLAAAAFDDYSLLSVKRVLPAHVFDEKDLFQAGGDWDAKILYNGAIYRYLRYGNDLQGDNYGDKTTFRNEFLITYLSGGWQALVKKYEPTTSWADLGIIIDILQSAEDAGKLDGFKQSLGLLE